MPRSLLQSSNGRRIVLIRCGVNSRAAFIGDTASICILCLKHSPVDFADERHFMLVQKMSLVKVQLKHISSPLKNIGPTGR